MHYAVCHKIIVMPSAVMQKYIMVTANSYVFIAMLSVIMENVVVLNVTFL